MKSNTSLDLFSRKVANVYRDGTFLAYRLTPEYIVCLFQTGATYTEVFVSNTRIGQIDNIKEHADSSCFDLYLDFITI